MVRDYVLRPDEQVILEEAGRTADLIGRLEEVIAEGPMMTTGSVGQLVPHPLLAEVRLQRASLDRLLCSMQLPNPGKSESPRRARDRAGRFTASPGRARWG